MFEMGGKLHRFRRCFGATLGFLLCGLTAPALAQSENAQEQAQRLFAEGLQLMQSEHCQHAVPLFQKSQQLYATAATLANLATCYARLGKTGSAYSTYQQAARAAILENKSELQRRTDQAAAKLAPTLTRLRVVPLGNGGLPSIRINGQLVEDVRTPIPLDPGENIVEATAPGRDPWRRTVHAQGEGALMVVEVPDLGSPREPARQEPPKTLPNTMAAVDEPPRHIDLRPYAAIAAGVGVTSIAVGTVLAFRARSKQNDAEAYCSGHSCLQPGLDLREQALDRAAFATWSIGIGLVSLGAAATLWVVSTRRDERAPSVSILPWVTVGRSSAGIALEGKL